KARTINREAQIHAKVDGKKVIISKASIMGDIQFRDEEGVDCLPTATIFKQLTLIGVAYKAVYKELDDSLVRSATTPSSLEEQQDSGNINKTQSKATPNESSSQRTDSVRLSARVESSEDEGLGKEDASKYRRIADIDANKDITLVSTHDEQMFDADQDLGGEEDKGKAIMIKEHVKLKKKDQIMLDEEVALKLQLKLQAEFDKEQRLASEKSQQEEEFNSSLIEE
nr:hypothetical protein [Tanacetum cinerariifolium]